MVEKLFCRIVPCLAASVLAVCCAKDGESVSAGRHCLNVNSVTTEKMLTKAVIDGTSFPQADAEAGIGLYLLAAADSSAYPEDGCSNVRYSNSGDGWKSDAPIPLPNKRWILCGSFPYDASFADCRDIPVESSLNGTDYMYAAPVQGSGASPENVDLTMRHALARLSLTFVKDASYKGDGVLSSISIEGDGVAASGHLDALTGSVTAAAAPVVFTVPAGEGAIIAGGLVKECLMVPLQEADTTRQSAVLKCTIDGKEYSLTLEGDNGVVVCQGIQSNVLVSVNAGTLTPMDVWVGDWGEASAYALTVDGEKDIAVELEDESLESDVLYSANSDGKDLVVEAFSKSGKTLLCSVPKTSLCRSSLDWESKIFKFVISGLKDNDTVVLGYPHDEGVLARVRTDVPRATAYDVFEDAGIFLDPGGLSNITAGTFSENPPSVYNTDGNTYSMRYVYCKDGYDAIAEGDSARCGITYRGSTSTAHDTGFLLWPDGEPQCKVYYCIGGKAENGKEHGRILGNESWEKVMTFVKNGGSFVGSGGAGTVFAGTSYCGTTSPYYLGLYPGNTLNTGVRDTYEQFHLDFPSGSPLKPFLSNESKAYCIEKDGVYLDETNLPAGVEILARYGNGISASDTSTHHIGKPAIWSYNPFTDGGRVVVCGSRLEKKEKSKDFYQTMSAEMRYAIAGSAQTKVKAVLHNGETILKQEYEDDPEHCGVGPAQIHHYVMDITERISRLELTLEWANGSKGLELYLKKDNFAIPINKSEYKDNVPDYTFSDAEVTDVSRISVSLTDLEPGLWYIAVKNPFSKKNATLAWSNNKGSIYGLAKMNKEELASLCIPYKISAMWTYHL